MESQWTGRKGGEYMPAFVGLEEPRTGRITKKDVVIELVWIPHVGNILNGHGGSRSQSNSIFSPGGLSAGRRDVEKP